MPTRPNFLVFITDQQRADHLSCMGNPVLHTPNIDLIGAGAGGCVFDAHHVNNPVCMPSRASLFTGRTPRGHRVRGNGIALDPATPTFTGALRAAGYRTHCVGKIHLSPYGLPRGADLSTLNPGDYPEAMELWESGRIQHLPANYFGLETTEVSLGHGIGVGGDYRAWVRDRDPAAEKYFTNPGRALRPPSGADQCHPWAIPEALHHSTWVAERTVAFLEEQARAQKAAPAGGARPFFTFASFPDPHHPYTPCGKWADLYRPEDVQLPRARREGELESLPPHFKTTFLTGMALGGRSRKTQMPDSHLREIIALTYGMLGLVDQSVGVVLDALTRLGLDQNTVVLYLSDHGDLMGDHWMHNKGPFLSRGLTRVPLLARLPNSLLAPTGAGAAGAVGAARAASAAGTAGAARAAGGRRIAPLSNHLDIAPTILDLAGVAIPEGYLPPQVESPGQAPAWPGRSLKPLLTGERAALDRPNRTLLEYDEDYTGDRLRGLLTPEFRVVLYPGRPYGELFDLGKDPDELVNLWDDPGAKPLKLEALAQLADELARTDSALPRRYCHA
ncbi:MAG: sulfatase family protein [Planctomycetota bacterium]